MTNKILITGNMGYIGPVLTRHLRSVFPGSDIIGYDYGLFGHCLTDSKVIPESRVDVQYFGDVRKIPDKVFDSVHTVIQLAAISNDPMGSKFEAVTQQINCDAAVNISRRAIHAGANRRVYASSCSMYGYAEGGARKEADSLNPLTAYAKSKVAAEQALFALDKGDAVVTSLRFSTACGMSERLRLDLVLNDFVASAIANRTVTVLSDGSPWRPLIDVKDMCRAIEWAIIREPKVGGQYLAINVGADGSNYQVRELAEAVAKSIPGTSVSINLNAPPDKRSYRVSFLLYKELAPNHQPQVDLEQTIAELKAGLEGMHFSDPTFRSSEFMRLKVLENHIFAGRLNAELNWVT
jgi:nucleoside-diphosphate-sugar epimerase